jgi:replicative DNA helicase
MPDYTHRLELERAILGACILENAYQRVADILSPVNFSDKQPCSHRAIFEAIASHYPAMPIDIITISRSLGPEYAPVLAELTATVCSAANLRYYALMLVEVSLREAFIAMISTLHDKAKLSMKAKLYEVQDEALDAENDIFQVIEKAKNYMAQQDEPWIMEAFEKFEQQINKRIHIVKNQAFVDVLMLNLTNLNLNSDNHNVRIAINHLTELIKYILSTGNVSHQTLNQIISISA